MPCAKLTFARARPGALELRIKLTPKSSREAVEGIIDTAEGPALVARVRAAPCDGDANEALCQLIAKWLRLSKSCVALTSGHKSRIKTLALSGDGTELLAKLESNCSQLEKY